jgi:hypothetical protein
VDIQGTDNHRLNDVEIGTVGAYADTQKAIYQSQAHPYDSKDRNVHAELFGGEDDPTAKYTLKSHSCDESGESKQPSTPVFNPQDFVRRTFLTDKQADGQQDRAKMVKLIDDITQDPVCIHDEDSGITWKLKRIMSHQGPLNSKYNIMIESENGEPMSEPLSVPAIAVLHEPQESVDILMRKYKFKLNGTGHSSYPPELDTSELLNDNKGIKDYCAALWAVSIGRLNITSAVATMSGFRIAPCQEHLDQSKCTYGYLSKMHHAMIQVRTDESDYYSDVTDIMYNWTTTPIYGELSEVLPPDAPSPLGNYVTLTHYANANAWDQRLALLFDIESGIIQDQGCDAPPSTKWGVTKSEQV